MNNKKCLIIVGPTAVGKTDVAMQFAFQNSTQIISADSRQCYLELNAGVAKPSSLQLSLVTHYFINSHSIHQDLNAAEFEEYALQKASLIFEHNESAVMVGGTGLYISAFCNGFDSIPRIDPVVRKSIISSFNEFGIGWLNSEIKERDPLYFSKGELKNPQRVMRALEVKISTGKSILEFQSGNKKKRDFKIVKIGLELPRDELKSRIDKRTDQMLESGLLEEAKNLFSSRGLNALQTVGYRELFEYLEDKVSLDEAVNKIKINTHRYAKRQMTWFKKDPDVLWKHPDDIKVTKI